MVHYLEGGTDSDGLEGVDVLPERFMYEFGAPNPELEAAYVEGKPLWLIRLLKNERTATYLDAKGVFTQPVHLESMDLERNPPGISRTDSLRIAMRESELGSDLFERDSEFADTLCFLAAHATAVSIYLDDGKEDPNDEAHKDRTADHRQVVARVRRSDTEGGRVVMEGERIALKERAYEKPYFIVIIEGLSEELTRDFWRLGDHHLRYNHNYHEAGDYEHKLGHRPPLESVSVAGAKVVCCELKDGGPYTADGEGTRYINIGNAADSIYLDGVRVPLGKDVGWGHRRKRLSFMTWNLVGMEHATDPDVRRDRPVGFQPLNEGVIPYAFALQYAMRRLKDPTLVRLLVQRMVLSEQVHPYEFLELLSLPLELQAKLGPFDPTTRHLILMAWQELFGASKMIGENNPLSSMGVGSRSFTRGVSIQHTFPPGRQIMSYSGELANHLPFDVPHMRNLIYIPRQIYAFLAEAGVPIENDPVDIAPEPPMEDSASEAPSWDQTQAAEALVASAGVERTYLCLEVDPAQAVNFAEHLALRGIESTVLALPEGLESDLFGPTSSLVYRPEVTPHSMVRHGTQQLLEIGNESAVLPTEAIPQEIPLPHSRTLHAVGSRQMMVRVAVAATVGAVMAGLVGAGMVVEHEFNLLHSEVKTLSVSK